MGLTASHPGPDLGHRGRRHPICQGPQVPKYLTLVYAGATRLLWVGKERTVEAFQGFFTLLGEELTSKIQFVCSDIWTLLARG